MNEMLGFGASSEDKKEENEAVVPTPENGAEEPSQEASLEVKKPPKEGITPTTELSPEEQAYADAMMGDLDQFGAPPLPEVGTEGPESVEKLESLFNLFEVHFDVVALLEVRYLASPDDALRFPIRELAKETLAPMAALLNKIKIDKRTEGQFGRLREQFLKYTAFVGHRVEDGTVVHE